MRLEVSDNGSGMTPETLRKAFDPFFTTKFVGRGMGLAVVQQIVRGLGGAIHVESSVGNGTSILIMLPCAHGVGFCERQATFLPVYGPAKSRRNRSAPSWWSKMRRHCCLRYRNCCNAGDFR